MRNDFVKRLEYIEEEIRRLKTASEYTSTVSSKDTSATVSGGNTYKITYAQTGSPLFATAGVDISTTSDFAFLTLEFQDDNTQIVKVSAETGTPQNLPLAIVSNRPITGIVQI